MNTLICILIIIGISLDVLGAMEIEGAMLGEIKKKDMVLASLLVIGLQLLFFFAGYIACDLVVRYDIFTHGDTTASIIAVAIFVLLGIRLLIKGIRRAFIEERRQEFSLAKYMKGIFTLSFYTLCAGCACGFIDASPLLMLVTMIICSVSVTVGGIFIGYHYGFGSKSTGYFVGTAFLWLAGIYVFVTGLYPVIAG
mgnify:CR=1 FL=1